MRVCQHFPFVLCSNGGSQRHRATFDASEFANEISLHEHPGRPLGEFWDEFQSVKSAGERLRLLEGSVNAANRGTENHFSSMFVATKHVFCRDKHTFVATNFLLRQNYVVVVTNIYRDKRFVATNIILSRQIFCRG